MITTLGDIGAPAVVLEGCPVNSKVAAAPAVTLNAWLVPGPGPVEAVAVNVYPVPTLSIANVENVATPLIAGQLESARQLVEAGKYTEARDLLERSAWDTARESVLEDMVQSGSPAVVNRGKKLLAKLKLT